MHKEMKLEQIIRDASSTRDRLFLSAIQLFSSKGFANVGIRELCRSVNIKESAFYNHFKSKDELLDEIFRYFIQISTREVFSHEKLENIIHTGNIKAYLQESMKAFTYCIRSPLYFTILQIITMESYTNTKAYAMVRNNDYILHTEKVLESMVTEGFLDSLDTKAFSISFYYCLKGLMHDFMLKDAWNDDTQELLDMIQKHVQLFLSMLKTKG